MFYKKKLTKNSVAKKGTFNPDPLVNKSVHTAYEFNPFMRGRFYRLMMHILKMVSNDFSLYP